MATKQQPPIIQSKDDAIRWQDQLELNVPKVGDGAPDFELADVAGAQSVGLSSFRGKRPVALIFGSFT